MRVAFRPAQRTPAPEISAAGIGATVTVALQVQDPLGGQPVAVAEEMV